MEQKMIETLAGMGVANRNELFNKPSDANIEYEDVKFNTTDNVELSGWLMNENSDKIVIFNHFGGGANRSGLKMTEMTKSDYAKDIDYIKKYKQVVDAGYGILAYDFRNCGESGEGKDIYTGMDEKHDVIAAVQFVTDKYPNAEIYLYSECFGAQNTIKAYGEEKGLLQFENIKGIYLNQPIRRDIVFKAMGIDEAGINAIDEFHTARGGLSFRDDFSGLSAKINVPVMIMQNENDPFYIESEWINIIKDNTDAEMYLYNGEKSRLAGYQVLSDDATPLINFLNSLK